MRHINLKKAVALLRRLGHNRKNPLVISSTSFSAWYDSRHYAEDIQSEPFTALWYDRNTLYGSHPDGSEEPIRKTVSYNSHDGYYESETPNEQEIISVIDKEYRRKAYEEIRSLLEKASVHEVHISDTYPDKKSRAKTPGFDWPEGPLAEGYREFFQFVFLPSRDSVTADSPVKITDIVFRLLTPDTLEMDRDLLLHEDGTAELLIIDHLEDTAEFQNLDFQPSADELRSAVPFIEKFVNG